MADGTGAAAKKNLGVTGIKGRLGDQSGLEERELDMIAREGRKRRTNSCFRLAVGFMKPRTSDEKGRKRLA